MSTDHYAILGVAPTAELAVIRAAYLALMREYHPDRNPSPAAVERAQAIIAAYRVLGDFDRRQEYDWDRRRSREAAAALLAAQPKRRVSAAVVIAAAFGLAVAGAMVFRPASGPIPRPDRLPDVEIAHVASAPARRARPSPPPVVKVAQRAAVNAPAPKEAPVEMVPELYPAPEPVAVKRVAAKAHEVRKTVREPVDVATKAVAIQPRPALATAIVKPGPKPEVRPIAASDLATLDQFVMAFYGQAWRFGDSRKRAALEHSRNSFVVRHGACLADACKRAAYLKLQSEVSAIVESQAPPR